MVCHNPLSKVLVLIMESEERVVLVVVKVRRVVGVVRGVQVEMV